MDIKERVELYLCFHSGPPCDLFYGELYLCLTFYNVTGVRDQKKVAVNVFGRFEVMFNCNSIYYLHRSIQNTNSQDVEIVTIE
jgi:hypothetical protein